MSYGFGGIKLNNITMLSVQNKIKGMSTADLFKMGTAICLEFAESKRLSGMERVFYYMIKEEFKNRTDIKI